MDLPTTAALRAGNDGAPTQRRLVAAARAPRPATHHPRSWDSTQLRTRRTCRSRPRRSFVPALRAYSSSASPVLEDVPLPNLGPADVRIEVAAAAVNPVDVAVVNGPVRAAVDLPDPIGLGWDVSGTITEIGSGVT